MITFTSPVAVPSSRWRRSTAEAERSGEAKPSSRTCFSSRPRWFGNGKGPNSYLAERQELINFRLNAVRSLFKRRCCAMTS
jgi:hypothetical protein